MYSTRPGLILGFHGCDKSVADKVLNGNTELNSSENTFDWLGNGIYFWEYSPERALEYVTALSNRKGKTEIKHPAIIGAVIDLGYCFDLIEYKNLQLLKMSYHLFKSTQVASGFNLPKNKPGGSLTDLLLRELDCAIIESIHQTRYKSNLRSYDSVKGVFQEGKELIQMPDLKRKIIYRFAFVIQIA